MNLSICTWIPNYFIALRVMAVRLGWPSTVVSRSTSQSMWFSLNRPSIISDPSQVSRSPVYNIKNYINEKKNSIFYSYLRVNNTQIYKYVLVKLLSSKWAI